MVNPDEVVREFGADSLRVYEMFMGPLEHVSPGRPRASSGVRNFLDRVHPIGRGRCGHPLRAKPSKPMHRTIKKVGKDIEALHLNTAVST